MGDWIVPDWPAPARVRAVFTTRAGGVSAAPYDALNLGDHVGDALADVQANRARLADAIAAQPVFLQQVHGRAVAHVTGPTQEPVVADASFTTQTGLACTAMVADCLPVLFTDTRGTVVAAAHAGWRGLLGADGQGVLESGRRSACCQVCKSCSCPAARPASTPRSAPQIWCSASTH